ncbi:hypothetical protein [Niallia taxi]|uniref:hypothetical protein n=1 Tax=Niallia taxi TaxID=2499688 RepID=UPI0015F3C7C3|nr:hypothetical protein [Niallia taxi]
MIAGDEEAKKSFAGLHRELKRFGYTTELIPKQINKTLWMINAVNCFGEISTIYLNEGRTGKVVMQSDEHAHIGIYEKEYLGLDIPFS